VLDGSAPVLLYGYGGFGISLLPSFASSRVLWVERAGAVADAVAAKAAGEVVVVKAVKSSAECG
jgi:hypothetical protein